MLREMDAEQGTFLLRVRDAPAQSKGLSWDGSTPSKGIKVLRDALGAALAQSKDTPGTVLFRATCSENGPMLLLRAKDAPPQNKGCSYSEQGTLMHVQSKCLEQEVLTN